MKSRNSKFERMPWLEPIERPLCFGLVERMVSPEPPELIEEVVALGAEGAWVAVELERFGSRYNPRPVVGIVAHHAPALNGPGEQVRSGPIQGGADRDEMAQSALREKARRCGAVSGSREVARRARLSARKAPVLCVARILR
ncbi:MAG: hypothetical protein ACREA2_13175 [Blastocatellia bacterium]